MTRPDPVESALTAARPKAIAALLRHFRDLDLAEEAFQEACLRALKTWPEKGAPRDPTAWLIFVGRNVAVDALRRSRRLASLPDEDQLSDLDDAEAAVVRQIDEADYRDDILRLLFVCCHPDLPAEHQVALALRVVSGLSVRQIARAFLVGESAMEQRITRAKGRIARSGVAFEAPSAIERTERLAAVAAMLYLLYNEGYTTAAEPEGRVLAEEAIRLIRLLIRLFPSEPEIMGLAAVMMLGHARAAARADADGRPIPLDAQDRSRWNRSLIAEGLALLDKALRHRRPGPYQIQAAIAALHARAPSVEATDWAEIELLYGALERFEPSPVIRLNRAVAVARCRGPAAALELIAPLESELGGYFYFHGTRGTFLMELGRSAEAQTAFGRAIALARNANEAAHIRSKLDQLVAEAAHSGK